MCTPGNLWGSTIYQKQHQLCFDKLYLLSQLLTCWLCGGLSGHICCQQVDLIKKKVTMRISWTIGFVNAADSYTHTHTYTYAIFLTLTHTHTFSIPIRHAHSFKRKDKTITELTLFFIIAKNSSTSYWAFLIRELQKCRLRYFGKSFDLGMNSFRLTLIFLWQACVLSVWGNRWYVMCANRWRVNESPCDLPTG